MGKGKRLLSVMCFVLALAVAVTAELPVVMPMEQVEAATKASMNKKSVTLFKGKSVKLKVTGVNGKAKWSSSKKSVATVSNGKVKAKKKGTAVITANVNGQKCTCKVTVEDPKINFKTKLYEDETLQLKVTGTKQTVKWKSSNKKIVAISSNGKVKAKSSGKATITARIGTVKLICKITVEEEDDEDDEDDYEDEDEEEDDEEEYDEEEDLDE